jgi:uroporphyrinogen decarboxylase
MGDKDSSHAPEVLGQITARREERERLGSKERVLAATNHQEPDRVPIDLWAASEVKGDLAAFFGCDYESLLDLVGVDFRVVRGPSYEGLEMRSYEDGTSSDLWGVRRKLVTYGEGKRKGSYKEVVASPLAAMNSVDEIEAYPGWPSPDWWDYSQIAEQCRQYAGKCVVFAGDRLDRTAQLKTAMYLRGVEQIMMDLALSPELVDCMLARITAYYLEYNERVFQASEGEIDIFMMGDDFGIQTGPMMSIEMWERFFEPGFRAFIQLAHKYGIKVMHHTCGSVVKLIPKFIDAGLDILQSIQPRAAGMDLEKLKREYGQDLAFHGSIDIQQTMPYGTPQDVKREVQQRMKAGKPGGGFIICTAHNLQRDVPVENITALLEAYHEFGFY